jgi:PBP1b-binding outer membrane lipoprotein LpoB
MKIKIKIVLIAMLIATCGQSAKAQLPVTDVAHIGVDVANQIENIAQAIATVTNTLNIFNQAKDYYDKLIAVNNLIKDAKKVVKIGKMVGEIQSSYAKSSSKILFQHFSAAEITAMNEVYSSLWEDLTDMLEEVLTVTTVSSLSMTDRERMQVIDAVYERVKHHRTLVNYYTHKNIAVAYAREDKAHRIERVEALYGSDSEKYW